MPSVAKRRKEGHPRVIPTLFTISRVRPEPDDVRERAQLRIASRVRLGILPEGGIRTPVTRAGVVIKSLTP